MFRFLLLGAWTIGVVSVAFAQTEEDQVKAVVDTLRQAIVKGDVESVGKAVSDSGFVALVGLTDETMCLSKTEFLALLGNVGTGAELQDLKVGVHWMVALVTGKVVPNGVPADQALVFDAIMVREAGQWKFAGMCICSEEREAKEDEVKAFVDRVAALPNSVKQGSASVLDPVIHDQKFVLALVDPSLEFRWATSKTLLTQMLDTVIPMITVNESRLDVSRTVLGPSVAIVEGTWLLDITDFGQTNTTIRAYAVKVDGQWRIVAIGGGPAK